MTLQNRRAAREAAGASLTAGPSRAPAEASTELVTRDFMDCPECRAQFEPRRRDQAYCSAACNKRGADRELARARRLYRALYHWRLTREDEGIGANLRFICSEISSWIREDREAQRKPPPPHDHLADRGHQRPRRPQARVGRRREA
jgi:hypothetical protein